ncbi:MAG: PilT/PilU family type 4a pilus ATPase [Betaproteobacteria bacterium]|jgi:twitching motility protein PilU|nr:PilT/PilU family type 4a pilus ATPase [Betaproteobacteria bacterium]
MSTSTKSQQAQAWLYARLDDLVAKQGSDLFLIADAPPAVKVNGQLVRLSNTALSGDNMLALALAIMTPLQISHFQQSKESNFAMAPPGRRRFRVNAFMQLGQVGMVFRAIAASPPSLDGMGLPQALKTIALHKRGLVVLVGATGAGKTTTMAAMVDWINQKTRGHIVTVEDPIEFLHPHKQCLVTQREIGLDTADWSIALKNALRQAPDVIVVGELRDREATDQALTFSETGHLVLATMHANNTNQALERIVSFFPENSRARLYMNLSLNVHAFISQRLVRKADGSGRVAAVEIMVNTPLIRGLIRKGEIAAIRTAMGSHHTDGMQTFQDALFALYESKVITLEEALRNADSMNDLRLQIKLHSKRTGINDLSAGTEHLGIV